MRAKLTNLSPIKRTVWVDVAVPRHSLTTDEMVFQTDRGPVWRASRGIDRGQTTFYHVRATLSGGESIEGTFEPGVHATAQPFTHSSWVTDDVAALVPRWGVRVAGVSVEQMAASMEDVSKSSTHETWRFHGRLGDTGFVATTWVKFYHLQDVARIMGRIAWSDRQSPGLDRDTDGVLLISGEPLALDYAHRNGSDSVAHASKGRWLTAVAADVGFLDGSAIPVWGSMMCLPSNQAELFEPANVERLNSIHAATTGPVFAVCDGWDGGWLAHNHIPRRGQGQPLLEREALADVAAFDALLATRAASTNGKPPHPVYANRTMGSSKTPGQTGRQQDHGATKGGSAVTALNPSWSYEARHAIAGDFFRGVFHFEEDGTPVRKANHPGWLTWDSRTHHRVLSRENRLGKDRPIWGDLSSTGWHGYDDQHRSANTLCAYLALNDDPMVADLIEHQLYTDEAMHPDRLGAPRAMGRLMLAWSNMTTVLDKPGADIAHERLHHKLTTLANQWRGGRHGNPVKVINSIHDPRTYVTDPNTGQPLDAWIVWEHGLAAVGLYALHKRAEGTSDGDLAMVVLREVVRTIVLYGTFREGSLWHMCAGVWYPGWGSPDEGKPIPPDSYSTASKLVNSRLSGTGDWILPAIMIATEVLDANEPAMTRALAIVDQFTGGQAANRWVDAEWWACVRKP